MFAKEDHDGLRPQTVGERLLILRHRKGLTVKRLSELSNVHRNTISAILNERLNEDPETSTIEALAEALEVAPHVLLPSLKSSDGSDRERMRVDSLKRRGRLYSESGSDLGSGSGKGSG